MADISIDASDLQRTVADIIEEAIKTESEGSARFVLEGVKAKTPVDTGRARDGWKMEIDGEEYRVFNEVPYIGFLEAGSSKQAPQGMVALTLSELALHGPFDEGT
jgi:hypothetical protein